MSNNIISSTTPPEGSPAFAMRAASMLAAPSPGGPDTVSLVRLNAALQSIEQLLAQGKPLELPQPCREAAAIAGQLSSALLQASLAGALAEDAERRKALLFEIRRRHAFCVSLLRRWRRMLSLQREIQAMAGEPVTYIPALAPVMERR